MTISGESYLSSDAAYTSLAEVDMCMIEAGNQPLFANAPPLSPRADGSTLENVIGRLGNMLGTLNNMVRDTAPGLEAYHATNTIRKGFTELADTMGNVRNMSMKYAVYRCMARLHC